MVTIQNHRKKGLSIQNPWWEKGGLWQDPDLSMIRSSFLSYSPRPISILDCERPGVLTLRGPRRSGKTVSLKLLISDLIEKKNWNPNQIIWTSFETFHSLSQVEEHLHYLLEEMPNTKAIFIDEATTFTKHLPKHLDDDEFIAI